jgi:GTP-binding protein
VESQLFADAAGPADFPSDGLPEVAVMGRSNVGKSSFINALTGRKRLARTSSTPGKTRRIHFYRLDNAMYLVDLPGYGYARAARSERASWRPMVESYLRGSRSPLRGAILLVDVRRGPEREELELLEWLDSEAIPARIAFTKADKLKASKLAAQVKRVCVGVEIEAAHCATVSAERRTGLGGVADWIREWTEFQLTRPDGGGL